MAFICAELPLRITSLTYSSHRHIPDIKAGSPRSITLPYIDTCHRRHRHRRVPYRLDGAAGSRRGGGQAGERYTLQRQARGRPPAAADRYHLWLLNADSCTGARCYAWLSGAQPYTQTHVIISNRTHAKSQLDCA